MNTSRQPLALRSPLRPCLRALGGLRPPRVGCGHPHPTTVHTRDAPPRTGRRETRAFVRPAPRAAADAAQSTYYVVYNFVYNLEDGISKLWNSALSAKVRRLPVLRFHLRIPVYVPLRGRAPSMHHGAVVTSQCLRTNPNQESRPEFMPAQFVPPSLSSVRERRGN